MKYIYVEHEDIKHFSENMLVNANVYQITYGQLQSFRKSLVLDNCTLFYRQSAGSLVANYSNVAQQFLIVLPLLDSMVNGKELTLEQLFLIGPNEVIHHAIPEGFQTFGIGFSYQQASRYLSDKLLQAIGDGAEAIRSNKIKLPFMAEFKERSIKLYEQLYALRDKASAEEIAELEKSLFALIEQLFTPLLKHTKLKSYLNSSRRNIVSRAIEHIVDNDLTDIPVNELADKCYCSMRSLEYAFKSIYKITPKQFLSVRRLHIVREKIKDQEFASLKDLMSHIGVSNPGRFSAQYFKLFGEYPRETWSRHKA